MMTYYIKPVSLSISKQKAKELAEKWLQKNAVNNSDYVFEGVVKINEDYSKQTF